MNILVAGGAGYIGSHTCAALLNAGQTVIVVDNLLRSRKENIHGIEQLSGQGIIFYQVDATDQEALNSIFERHRIDAVIHLAGFKTVVESIRRPLYYYYNNLLTTITLSQACLKYGVNKFIFSSSASVYGQNPVPFTENMAICRANNPYGESKIMSEKILIDIARNKPSFSLIIFRYFNPIGAHESGLIGDNTSLPENSLIGNVIKIALTKNSKLIIYGNDYPSHDGTAVRDFVHVCDLAEAHAMALLKMPKLTGINIYNLGTGKGISILQLVAAFEDANDIIIPYEFRSRRPGDLDICYADPSKARFELNWQAKRGLHDMVRDSWVVAKKQNC